MLVSGRWKRGLTKESNTLSLENNAAQHFPPIWRQVQVWENATLAQLHRVLQMVMGWENYHPYEFRIDGKI